MNTAGSGIAVLTVVTKANENTQKALAADQNSPIVTVTYLFSDDEDHLLKDLSALESTKYDEARIIGSLPSEDVLAEIFRLLKLNCKLWIKGSLTENDDTKSLNLNLKIQGFKSIISNFDQALDEQYIYCEKPNWEVGTSSGIVIPTGAKKNVDIKTSAWKISVGDLADEDLIDENDLLDDIVIIEKPADCGVDADGVAGKKRACKNCSCGLKEIEQEAERSGIILADVPKSGCGSCAKGDAFRCAGCPFLGKPAFEPGNEKLILAMGDDDI